MRRLIVQAFVSLDGVMQAPGGPEEDPDRRVHARRMGRELLGRGDAGAGWRTPTRRTSCCSGAGPTRSSPHTGRTPRGRPPTTLNAHASTSRRRRWRPSTGTTTLIDGDVPEAVAALKREDGPEIQVHGSVGLIQTLLTHDLIDELRVWTFPLVLGTGKRLFGDGAVPAALRLVANETTATGVTISTYEPAGAIESGSFEFDEPTEAELERRRRLRE